MQQRPPRDRGAATVVTAGLIAAIAALTSLSLPLYSALVVKQSVGAAADAAALAAADVAVGRVAGIPCAVAARVAASNGAAVTACRLDGLVATVTAGRTILGVEVTARATAGPAPGEPD
jgi:secretion/DNA translocation related TadE-like protein